MCVCLCEGVVKVLICSPLLAVLALYTKHHAPVTHLTRLREPRLGRKPTKREKENGFTYFFFRLILSVQITKTYEANVGSCIKTEVK